MLFNYTAIIQQSGEWWIGWVEEVPGVNSQGASREELLENPREALDDGNSGTARAKDLSRSGNSVRQPLTRRIPCHAV